MLETYARIVHANKQDGSLENSFCHLRFHSIRTRIISRVLASNFRKLSALNYLPDPTLAISFLSL